MRCLLPTAADPTPVIDDDLPGLYAYPPLADDRPWLRANMISSLDGAAHGPDGRSATLGTARDAALLAMLRAQADVIIVGTGTVHAEGYGPVEADPRFASLRSAAGQAPTPPIAVVSRELDLDPSMPLFTEAPADARTIVITVEDAPSGRRRDLEQVGEVIVAGTRSVDPHHLLDVLVERGHRRLLTEGGPHLLRNLIAADVVDELCLTIALHTAGGGAGRILAGAPTDPLRWRPHLLLLDDDLLIGRWFRHDRQPLGVG